MKKKIDLFNIFIHIGAFCLLSMALPLALGLLWLIGELAFEIRNGINERFGVWQFCIFGFTGLMLKIYWWDDRQRKIDEESRNRASFKVSDEEYKSAVERVEGKLESVEPVVKPSFRDQNLE